MITDDDKERVRQATDIVALVSETVVLRPRGSDDFWGCCPFHQEKSPSFHVRPSTGLWHCFGCNSGGDVFDYVMRREGLDFLDAVRYLADRAHIDIDEATSAKAVRGPKRTRLFDALEAAQDAFSLRLMRGKDSGADAARHYLSGRGLNSGVCARWHLGYADESASLVRELMQAGFTCDELVAADLATVRDGRTRNRFFNRAMFPIHDERGRCIGFGGRVVGEGRPKYLNTKETSVFHKSKHLFAFDRAKQAITAQGVAIVTEGYLDVIAMHEAGFTNTVAVLGTALSQDHVTTLARFAHQIICMFDGDAAGQHAAEAAVRFIEGTKASLTCVVLPDGQDPDEFLRTHGPEQMRARLDDAQPLLDFVLERKLATLDLSTPGLRLAALDEFAGLLAPFKHSYLLDNYAQRLTVPLGMSLEAVKDKIRSTPIQPLESSRTNPVTEERRHGEPVPGGDGPVAAGASATRSAVSLAALSSEERTQIRAEVNLLGMLAAEPDLFRPYAERIATFAWADARHEAIAWAILATPEKTAPSDAVLAAEHACADAPKILSAGGFALTSSWSEEKNVEFVVNEAEIRSLDRRITQLSATLDTPRADQLAVLRELGELRRRRAELRAAQPLE